MRSVYFSQLNLIGVKDDTPVHFCDKCGLPIKIYGRMVRRMLKSLKHSLSCWRSFIEQTLFCFLQIPCKHVFCYDCAVHYEKKCDKMCPGWVSPTTVYLSGLYIVLKFELNVKNTQCPFLIYCILYSLSEGSVLEITQCCLWDASKSENVSMFCFLGNVCRC